MTELPKTYAPLAVYFAAAAFLHVAYKTSRTGLTDDLMDSVKALRHREKYSNINCAEWWIKASKH